MFQKSIEVTNLPSELPYRSKVNWQCKKKNPSLRAQNRSDATWEIQRENKTVLVRTAIAHVQECLRVAYCSNVTLVVCICTQRAAATPAASVLYSFSFLRLFVLQCSSLAQRKPQHSDAVTYTGWTIFLYDVYMQVSVWYVRDCVQLVLTLHKKVTAAL